jgi:hypothetical protein
MGKHLQLLAQPGGEENKGIQDEPTFEFEIKDLDTN